MKIKIDIMPLRDSYNSYPEDIEVVIEDDTVTMEVGDQTLVFDQMEFLKVSRLAYK